MGASDTTQARQAALLLYVGLLSKDAEGSHGTAEPCRKPAVAPLAGAVVPSSPFHAGTRAIRAGACGEFAGITSQCSRAGPAGSAPTRSYRQRRFARLERRRIFNMRQELANGRPRIWESVADQLLNAVAECVAHGVGPLPPAALDRCASVYAAMPTDHRIRRCLAEGVFQRF